MPDKTQPIDRGQATALLVGRTLSRRIRRAADAVDAERQRATDAEVDLARRVHALGLEDEETRLLITQVESAAIAGIADNNAATDSVANVAGEAITRLDLLEPRVDVLEGRADDAQAGILALGTRIDAVASEAKVPRSEEHTSELQ